MRQVKSKQHFSDEQLNFPGEEQLCLTCKKKQNQFYWHQRVADKNITLFKFRCGMEMLSNQSKISHIYA